MQKVLRQNLLRRNQNIRTSRKKDLKQLKQEWVQHDRVQLQRDRDISASIKAERKARREDWIQGPLAPNRNVGLQKGVYGTIPASLAKGPELPQREREVSDELMFAIGDKVVVVRGNARGKIGKITEISIETAEVTLDGVNTADVPIPVWAPGSEQRKEKFVSTNIPVPISDIRLTMQSIEGKDSSPRDIVIRQMYAGPPYTERPYGSSLPPHTRYIAGEDLELPWPREDLAEYTAEPIDTLRQDVDIRTYIPRVLDPELPEGVEDELRHKHAKGRGRLDTVYMQQKLLEDARAVWEKQRRLVTPLEEHLEMLKKKRQAEAPTEMSEETRAIIRQTQLEKSQNITRRQAAGLAG